MRLIAANLFSAFSAVIGVAAFPRRALRLLGAAALLALAGCSAVEWVGIKLFYRKAHLAEGLTLRDIPYRVDAEADPQKHRLDLFLPAGSGWPTLVYIHGGWWREGDRTLRVAGEDVYGNIGRFYASQGFGVAVVSYRLQPGVTWRDQLEDVARALAWLHGHVRDYGGNPEGLALCGHSAGGHLAARAAVDTDLLRKWKFPPGALRCVISVSGVGFDFADQETYKLGANRTLLEELFARGENGKEWEREASVIPRIGPETPPFLVLYAEGEPKHYHRQAWLLDQALVAAGFKHQVVVVPGESHVRILLTLSRPDKAAAPAILTFLRERTSTR